MMKLIYKSIFLIYMIVQLSYDREVSYAGLIVLLLILAVHIFQEKFFDKVLLIFISLILTAVGTLVDDAFIILFSVVILDFIYKRFYAGLIFVLFPLGYSLIHFQTDSIILILLLMGVSAILGFLLKTYEDHQQKSQRILDEERRLRYELEQTKIKLLNSSREVANIAEVRERNRIAREIHDSIGHSIAGILIQLQAADKLQKVDQGRAASMLKNCIDGFANVLDLLRDTVHNIKPKESLGIDYFKKIVQDFTFCPVQFSARGDFNQLPSSHIEILSTNLKEALTNITRYSQATTVQVDIDINEQYTRLYIKDNGIGVDQIKEGLGLSGMKERVENIGGTISISSQSGFLIVCLLPRVEGRSLFENINR